jgi:hypothetical protein
MQEFASREDVDSFPVLANGAVDDEARHSSAVEVEHIMRPHLRAVPARCCVNFSDNGVMAPPTIGGALTVAHFSMCSFVTVRFCRPVVTVFKC